MHTRKKKEINQTGHGVNAKQRCAVISHPGCVTDASRGCREAAASGESGRYLDPARLRHSVRTTLRPRSAPASHGAAAQRFWSASACARTDKSADTLWATGAGLSAVGGRSYPSGRGGLQEPCHAGLGSELYQLVCNVNTNGQYGNKHRGVCVRVRVNTRGSISYPALGRRHPGSDEHAAAPTAVSTHRSPTGAAGLLGERSARGWGTGNTGETARSRHRARSERRPHGHSCTSLGKNTQGGRGGLKPT